MATKKSSTDKDGFQNHYFYRVYDVTRLIPQGRVSTYGAIADFLSLGSARMVGWALNKCHTMEDEIPAHRVVNRKGELSGSLHFNPPGSMETRLKKEGIKVHENKIVDMDALFWHPREIEEY